ncbi:hypothetical protein [Ruminococcus sp. 210702-SL.1.03]|nr:hypothetical protein [Ruminococcus sp. 210702-SL.1.03]MCB6615746.1 hypothetical protein [Ruminococcus sp. 210702-SL.1.03]
MKSFIEWLSKPSHIKIAAGALFFALISYLSFCNGENMGRFVYTILH